MPRQKILTKMRRLFPKLLNLKKNYLLSNKISNRYNISFNFDSNEEILNNYLEKVMLIGINLPDTKNLLTETAIESLCESLIKFDSDPEMTAAVLHGSGGNFCTGVISSEKALEYSKKVINVMNNLKKPIIASLEGKIVDFGFQLAIMCDIKAMDETSIIGFGRKTERTEILPIVYQRLIHAIGLSKTLEMTSTNCFFSAKKAYESGFSNTTVTCGAALGQAFTWARSVALTPVEKIIEERSKILSCVLK